MLATNIQTLNGAKIVIETLKSVGVDKIFGYPGGIVLGVYDELSKQSDITHYLVRHEQAAIHAAEGYARVTGKCGIAIVTSGPGATNIVTGLANAYLDGFPLIVITGQVSKELLHQNAFQEVDIIDITKSCTKKNFQVKSIDELEDTLIEAYKVAMEGKKGPVVVDITKNVFSETCEFKSKNFSLAEENADYDVDDIVNLINNSKFPIIVAGGGSLDACQEIFELSVKFNIPVVSTMMGLGNFPMSHQNYIGMIGIFGDYSANQAVRESDLIISAGARFNDRIRCCFQNGELSKKLIQIDINPDEISRVIPASVGICGDVKNVLAQVLSKITLKNDDKEWLNYVISLKLKNKQPQKRSNYLHTFEVIQEINKYAENLVITTEVGQHQVWASRYLKFDKPKKFLTSGGLGTMGFGFPAAIGASIAQNNTPVICIAGDGSIQMNIQELATCMDYKLPIKVMILNNGYLGMVRQFQENMCDERYFATKISNPDFVKLAESYGAKGIRVDNINNLQEAISEAFEYDGPVIIDFIVEPMELL